MFLNEYEKWRMRQNPVTSRIQVGGRQMPTWFSSSLVQNEPSRRPSNALPPPPPPPPTRPPPQDESEYEEIDHLPRYTNTIRNPAVNSTAPKRTCSLCGNSNPVVCCEMCNNQIFCGSCNDMYHRHPKRHNHIRKLLDPPFENRPPIPPKSLQPVPPPRRLKKLGIRSATSSPTTVRKSFFDPFGSLRRSSGINMEQRPLPPPPKPGPPPLPPKSMGMNPHDQFRQSQSQRNIPQTVLELSNQQQNQRRNNFMMNDPMNFPWKDDRGFPINNSPDVMRGRAQSISTSQLDRFNSSSNLSHIATLKRQPKRPIICGPPRPPPPPIPPREYPQQRQQQQHHHHPHSIHSASAFNLNQLPMDDSQFEMNSPWMQSQMSYPTPFQQHQHQQQLQQQRQMMFYPNSSGMKRTPSSSSMTSGQNVQNQPIFNPWSTIRLAQSQSLTASERELEMISARRGSEPPPPYGNQVIRQVGHHDMMKPINRHHSYQDNEFPFDQDQEMVPPSPPPPPPSSQLNHRESFSSSRNVGENSRHKGQSTRKSYESADFWQCEWCTLINSCEKNICSVCCKTRKESRSSPAQEDSLTEFEESKSQSKSKSGGGSGHKKQSSFVRSTLTFTRNDKDKTSPLMEKQIIKVEKSEEEEEEDDDDDDVAGDPSTSPSSEEEVVIPRESYHRQERKKNVNKSKTPLTSSNEQVYTGVPLQTLTISPKPEFIEPKGKVSTGVGSSPPRSEDGATTYLGSVTSLDQELRERKESLSKKPSSQSSSQSPDSKSFKASHVIELKKMMTAGVSTSTSTSTSPTTTQSFTEPIEIKLKTSKGTSPPPQSISTQTYDELPTSKMGSKSTSRSSIIGQSGVDLLDERSLGGRTVKEMSDKELRYSRKAQQQTKLKRSMSTHLYSAATTDPWMIEANEGRHLYRSSSRHSLASDTRSLPLSGPPSREASPPRSNRFHQDFRSFGPGPITPSWDRFPSPADYFASIDDLVNRHRKESGSTRIQESELTKLLKEAAELNFTPEDVQVALRMCGERNPIKWLQDNWGNMVETVQTLATKYGREKGEEKNQVGTISIVEAREALRLHKGNVWLSVTDCVEQRRKKFLELQARGNFLREDILTALTANHGKLDSAYVELSKAQLKPFLMQMQIWGPPMGVDNESAPFPQPPSSSSSLSGEKVYVSNVVDNISPMTTTPLDFDKENDNSANSPQNAETEGNRKLTSGEEAILLPLTLPLDLELPSEMDLQLLQTKRSSLEDEQFMDADDFLKDKESILTPDPEESEAFVSDLLQNFQVGEIQSPEPCSSSSLVPPPSFSDSEKNVSQVQQVVQVEQAKHVEIMTLSTSDSKVEPTSTTKESLQIETTGSEESQVGLTLNSDTIVQSKLGLHFSMEAVLELLDQQRIKLLKEQQQLKNKEIQLIEKMKESKVHQGQATSQNQIDNLTPLEHQINALLSSTSTNTTTPNTIEFDSLIQPQNSLVASQTTTTDHGHDSRTIVASTSPQKNEADIDDSIKSKTVFGRQVSTESGDGDGDLDVSIYEEVSSGENLTEYLAQLNQNGEASDESEEEEEEEEELSIREDTGDISIDSSEESIETHSELSEGETDEEDEIEMIDQMYEKIEILDSSQSIETNSKTIKKLEKENEMGQVASTSQATTEKEKEKKIEPVKEVKPEIKRLMDSGLSDSFEHAERAVQLMDMKFTEEDSVYAAKECTSIYAALSYLQQDCLLCAGKFSATQMISMLRCTHWCCKSCAKDYFIVQLRDHGILDATCPFCKEPSNLLEDPDVAAEYFNHLDILLKNLLETKYHEMFQRKLRDWTLAKTPNFKWCSKCSSGFITEPLQTRLVCPDCSAVTCAVCLEPWDRTHDHRDQTFVRLCDSATKSIVEYLNENCIECPRCHLKFALARGGCMHLTCSQCRYEFCSGCTAQFRLSSKCHEGPFCEKLGLHAHHPRNCLFYLRDKEPEFLAQLLEENAIPYLSETAKDGSNSLDSTQTENRKCRVAIQKETEAGLQDDICGSHAPPGFATVCQAHYIEYLGLLIWQNHLDPISILSNDDLETIIKRARGHVKCPGRAYGTKDADYRIKLLQVINDEIPL